MPPSSILPAKRQTPRLQQLNPVAFLPAQVTFFASAVYIALAALLLWTHLVVPSAPAPASTPAAGVNLSAAWQDLAFITNGFHPWHSRRNGEVREYLIQRVEEIVKENGVGYKLVEQRVGVEDEVVRVVNPENEPEMQKEKKKGPRAVTIFKDDRSNVTLIDDFRRQQWTCYGESENVLVYIRGTSDDEQGDWWERGNPPYDGQSGVLVNAHYDSVSTGYGATDDGMGVVTILQLIAHFTTEGHQPKRGIVALFNEGEEAALYGSFNYLRHPLAPFTHTFLNLEGAAAGGRAVLFRTTDTEVTRFFGGSPRPFGNVVASDGFKRGLISSGTDYSTFSGNLGMRGMDLAFYDPRSRYHTDQDDLRHTSPDSLWHMLSASLSTVQAMTSYEGDEFEGSPDRDGRLELRKGSNGVWFDVFGRTFAVFQLHTLFAISVTLLVVGPLLLIVLEVTLRRMDRWYPLSRRQHLDSTGDNGDNDDSEPIHFSGLRGLFRFPIGFVVATAAVYALAYLLAKINPFIVFSSEWAVWIMMLCAWFAVAWFFFAGADRIRPTALQRMYSLIWMYALTWIGLVLGTVGENDLHIASSYLIVIYHGSVLVALLISYLEVFGLPTKTAYMEHVVAAEEDFDRRSARPGSRSSRTLLSQGGSRSRVSAATTADDEDATESTSLLHGSNAARSSGGGGTFTGVAKRSHVDDDDATDYSDDPLLNRAYSDEQPWSSSLLQWTWIVQFLILAPINLILVGQVALLVITATHMTPSDGGRALPVYLLMATFTVLLLLPLSPFMHRFKYQVPTFLFLVFLGTLIYSLLAFPFSADARMKYFFVQRMDLVSGNNTVVVQGVDGYIQQVIAAIPSAMGKELDCKHAYPANNRRSNLRTCGWSGLPPHVAGIAADIDSMTHDLPFSSSRMSSKKSIYTSWLDYNITHEDNTAHFTLRGRNSKACRLVFDEAVETVVIDDTTTDPRVNSRHPSGSNQVRLFSREWEKTFVVNVTWPAGTRASGQTGEVMCLWADANDPSAIPALQELLRYTPVWTVPVEMTDSLVEGYRRFEI